MTAPLLKDLVGRCDVLMVTFDTLRYDAATKLHEEGRTPHLSQWLGPKGWERRHSPGSFTLPAHQSLFAGFGPTPTEAGSHARSLALPFPGSNTITEETLVLEASNILSGFSELGYRTVCIGGVGFFNPETPLGGVLPGYFQEAYWDPRLGVTDRDSHRHQIDLAQDILANLEADQRVFLFLNISAIHQPNFYHLPGAREDSLASHEAALEAVDLELGRLFVTLRERGEWYAFLLSDHGTCYGEEGHYGHRRAHPLVWTVPYREGWL